MASQDCRRAAGGAAADWATAEGNTAEAGPMQEEAAAAARGAADELAGASATSAGGARLAQSGPRPRLFLGEHGGGAAEEPEFWVEPDADIDALTAAVTSAVAASRARALPFALRTGPALRLALHHDLPSGVLLVCLEALRLPLAELGRMEGGPALPVSLLLPPPLDATAVAGLLSRVEVEMDFFTSEQIVPLLQAVRALGSATVPSALLETAEAALALDALQGDAAAALVLHVSGLVDQEGRAVPWFVLERAVERNLDDMLLAGVLDSLVSLVFRKRRNAPSWGHLDRLYARAAQLHAEGPAVDNIQGGTLCSAFWALAALSRTGFLLEMPQESVLEAWCWRLLEVVDTAKEAVRERDHHAPSTLRYPHGQMPPPTSPKSPTSPAPQAPPAQPAQPLGSTSVRELHPELAALNAAPTAAPTAAEAVDLLISLATLKYRPRAPLLAALTAYLLRAAPAELNAAQLADAADALGQLGAVDDAERLAAAAAVAQPDAFVGER
jgi:hypothetical protein